MPLRATFGKRLTFLSFAVVVTSAVVVLSAADGNQYWAQWRGPDGTGVSKLAKPPVEWSETKNIRWKKEIPGRGAGTPVIWDNLVFLSTAVPVGVTEAQAHAARGTSPGPHKYVVM